MPQHRILVVEDNELVRELAVRIVGGMGYEVIEACDGPAALAAFDRDAAIDLVFSDVVLPGGLSCGRLIDEIRTRRPDLKILLTSGYSEIFARAPSASRRIWKCSQSLGESRI